MFLSAGSLDGCVYQGRRIAVVIPAYNEELLIQATLDGLPEYVDLAVVVDDASTDRTSENVREWTEVRKDARVEFDIHDRVNFSATHSFVRVDPTGRTITLELQIDTAVSDILEYFEIFLTRMMMCRRAAEGLDCKFRMTVNGHSLL